MFCNPTLFLPIFRRMQSFFVASVHFSVQNRGMQDQKPEKKRNFIKKIGILNLICITLFLGVLLASAGALAYMYRGVSTHQFGEHGKDLPWFGKDLVVTQMQCGWMDVSSNSWMRMNNITRTPYIKLELGECTGSGTLYVRFKSPKGEYTGTVVTMLYRNGQFDNINRNYYVSNGKTAIAYCYPVYDNNIRLVHEQDMFLNHCINEREKHWQAEVSHIPSGAREQISMGYTTLPKELHQPEK